MIIDTSALIAILWQEPEAQQFADSIEAAASNLHMSAATFLETGIVLDGSRDPIVARSSEDLVSRAGIAIEPVTAQQVKIAREAYRDFGKGNGHPAGLNFGDVFAYALAKLRDEPLLFKGNDFRETDIEPALNH